MFIIKAKKYFSIALFFLMVSFSGPSWSASVADGPNFGAQIHENIQVAIDWGKEKALMIADMDLKSIFAKLEMDAMYNGFANMIGRTGAAMQEIQNLELMEKFAPDMDLCGNVSYSLHLDTLGCEVADKTYEQVYQNSVDQTRFTFVGEDYGRFVSEKSKQLVDECTILSDVDINNIETTKEQALQYSQCFQIGKVFGSGVSANTLTRVESEALNNAIQIMVDPIPKEKRAATMLPGSDEYNKLVLEESRESLAKIMAINSLQEVKSWRDGIYLEDGTFEPSKLATLQSWIDEKDANWMIRVGGGNTGGDIDISAYPSELVRKSIEISRWQAELQLEQFKQQLRHEGLVAMQLAIMSDGL